MNFRKHFAVLSIIFLTLSCILSANQPDISTLKGFELSNDLYNFLKKSNTSPYAQPLLNNGTNDFPFNIYIEYPSSNNLNQNFILVFPQEQISTRKNLILDLIKYIQSEKPDCNITILFSYGDNVIINKTNTILGSQVFIESLNTNEDYTALLFDLDNTYNKILTSSNGKLAPSWLIKNEYNIYLEEGLNKKLPFYYLSQIYNMPFFIESQLENFLVNNVPAVKLCLESEIENDRIYDILIKSISAFAKSGNKNWEQHFLLINFFGKYYNLEETAIIKIIISITFSWLLFIFILGFVNNNFRFNTYFKIRKIWFIIPSCFILAYLPFILTQGFFNLVADSLSPIYSIYFCCTIQIIISFLIVNLIYILFLLFNYKTTNESLDFLFVVACFINQALFILLDISLFPIFMTLFVLSVLAYYIKNNIFHIIIFAIYILAFIPYCTVIITNGEIDFIKSCILVNKFTPFTVSLSIYPLYILYLRIITGFKQKFRKLSSTIIFSISSYLIIALGLLVFSTIRCKNLSEEIKTNDNYRIIEAQNEIINVNYSDKVIFTDIIRYIEIDLPGMPEVCNVVVNSSYTTPVLYSDNDYETITPTSVAFNIPQNPPSHLSFSYGANKEPCTITVTAFYPSITEEYLYSLVTKVISIGD